MVTAKTTIWTKERYALLVTALSTLGLAGFLIYGAVIPDSMYVCETPVKYANCLGGLSTGLGTICYEDTAKTIKNYCRTDSGWISLSEFQSKYPEGVIPVADSDGKEYFNFQKDGIMWKCASETLMKTDGTLDKYFVKADTKCTSDTGQIAEFSWIWRIFGG